MKCEKCREFDADVHLCMPCYNDMIVEIERLGDRLDKMINLGDILQEKLDEYKSTFNERVNRILDNVR